ncbi:VOC family protein [Aquabacter spiritensis]|uniref:Catechol 2,3-dioxygenase n=1 Tax=Aquabacter spiritensis TaxID=933073 RepID=A0A4R3M0P3_9HYPH|nr:VOC family protein [Aquabacter spiritensis]TCT06156.1 catechol 2,3-dioxygenase [Aquabacter spiritensis]
MGNIVRSVQAVDIAVTDLPAARRFFEDAWHLEMVAEAGGVVHLRASGPHFSVLSLRQADRSGLIRIRLEAQNPAAVDQTYARALAAGHAVDGPPRALGGPGGGYGFGLVDPEGRNFSLVHGMAQHDDRGPVADRPTKLAHVNLNARDNDTAFGFLREMLGFELSDQTRMFRFLRCGPDHHSLVLGFSDNAHLNHIAFEMPDTESLMRGIGRLRDHGHAVEWGPGRHGPGHNVFAYFCGPEELPLEYTSEVAQIDDTYEIRRPEEWRWPPGRLDHWGLTPGPSERVKRAQSFFPFIAGGHRLD